MPKLRRLEDQAERFWREADRDAYVPLSVAAAVTLRVQGSLGAFGEGAHYRAALDAAAAALSRLVRIYTSIDSRHARAALVLDPAGQTFVRGATQLRSEDGTTISDLSVRRSEVVQAMSRIGRLDLAPAVAEPPTPPGKEAPHTPRRNRLLAALPAQDYERVAGSMEIVHLRPKETLYTPGIRLEHVYFPVSGLVSLLYVMKSGVPTQVAIVGNDGLAGLAVVLNERIAARWAIVQLAGYAYRMNADAVADEFMRRGAIQALMLRYIQAFMTQMSQTSLCNRHHTVEQHLCRWLLMSLDRIGSGTLDITQEQISDMLGARRASISEAAGRLQKAGAIRYTRGHIYVSDRLKLEAHACECYEVIKRQSELALL